MDDIAAASVHITNLPKATYVYHSSPMLSYINVGYGSDVSVAETALDISQVVVYTCAITFDATKPDDAPRK